MKKRKAQLVIVFMMFVGAGGSAAFALAPMGPPKATLEPKQWALGFGYDYQQMDLDAFGTVRENPGSGWLPCDYTKYEIKGLTSNTFLGSLGYGLCDHLNAFLHVGMADARDEISEPLGCGRSGSQYYGLSSNSGLLLGFGAKASLCEDTNLSWGGLFQMIWSNPGDGSIKLRGDSNFSGNVDFDFWEIQIAAGPTLRLNTLSFYGGPFLHFLKGNLHLQGSTVDSLGVTHLVESKANIREGSIFGGYGGVQWDIKERVSWYTEYHYTGDAWAAATGVLLTFK